MTAREILEKLVGNTSQTAYIHGKPIYIQEHEQKYIDTALCELSELLEGAIEKERLIWHNAGCFKNDSIISACLSQVKEILK